MKKKLLIFLAILLVALLGLAAFLKTANGQQFIFNRIAKSVSDNSSYRIETKSIDYKFPLIWTFKDFIIYKENQKFLSIENLHVQISFWDLIQKKIHISQLLSQNIHHFRIKEKDHPASTNQKITIPNLPELTIDHFETNHFVTDYLPQTPFYLKGRLASSALINFEGKFLISGTPNYTETTVLFIHNSQQNEKVITHLDIQEPPSGILQKFNKVPFSLGWNLNLKLHYPLASLKALGEGAYQQLEIAGPLKFDFTTPDESGTISSHINLFKEQIEIQDLIADSTSLQAQGFLRMFNGKDILGKISLEVKDLKKFDSQLEGKIHSLVDLKGPFDHLYSQIHLNSAYIKYQNSLLEQVKGSVNAHLQSFDIDGDYQFEGHLNQIPFESSSLFTANPQSSFLQLKDLKIFVFNSLIQGLVELKQDTVEGNIQIGSENIHQFSQTVLQQDAYGPLHLLSHVYYHNGKLDLAYSLESPHLKLPGLRINELKAKGEIIDALSQPFGSLELYMQSLSKDQWKMEAIKLSTQRLLTESRWNYLFEFAHENHTQLAMEGNLLYAQRSPLEGDLHQLTGHLYGQPINLASPFEFRIQNNTLQTSSLALRLGQEGYFEGAINYSPEEIQTQALIKNIPLDFYKAINPNFSAKGIANGALNLQGPLNHLKGNVNFTVDQFKILEESFAKVPPFQASFSGTLENEAINASGLLQGVAAKPIEFKAFLPVDISVKESIFRLKPDQPIEGKLVAQGQIGPLIQLFFSDSTLIDGDANVLVELQGTGSNPIIKGTAEISRGSFESTAYGTLFNQIDAKIVSDGQTISLEHLRAKDGGQGNIEGRGKLNISKEQNYPYQFDFNLHHAQVVKLDYFSTALSGTLNLSGKTSETLVKGDFSTDSLEITSPKKSTTPIQTVEVSYVNVPRGQASPVPVANPTQSNLKLDINIRVPSNAHIFADNMTSEWKGHVKITGTPQAALLDGELKVVKGEAKFNGKTFEINQGTINFNGDFEKKTTLYIIASQDLGEIVAEIILKGSIKKPAISFRSNPPLSQREILSWLLFGHGTSDNTAFQGDQLNQSITELNMNNASSGPDMLTRIRSKLGIDQIDIKKSDTQNENVSVKVGKTISKGLVVTVNKGLTNQSNGVGVEANLTKNIKIEAEVGDNSSTQLLLKWKKNY